MKRVTLMLAALALLIGGVREARADLVNGGFETGDLTGWTANPSSLVSVVNSYQTYGSAYSPVDGNYFAVLSAGAGPNTYTTLSQTFTATAGQTISGSAFFQANDYPPYNDDGYVQIVENGQVLFASNVDTVGAFGQTPWAPFSYTFGSGGSYTIQAGVENDFDNNLSSALGIDNVHLSSVPEPSGLALLGLGVVCLAVGYAARRRTLAPVSA